MGVCVGASDARAAAIWAFEEVGSSVVGTLSGTLDVSGLTPFPSPSYDNYISPFAAQITASGPNSGDDNQPSYAVTGPGSFGSGLFTGGAATGDEVELVGIRGRLYLPVDYAGGALSTVLTLSGETFSSLGITPGSYVYSLVTPAGAGDTLTVSFTPAGVQAVPLPATLPMLLGAFGLAWAGFRRR